MFLNDWIESHGRNGKMETTAKHKAYYAQEERTIIGSADAVIEPHAVVVEVIDATIAFWTVLCFVANKGMAQRTLKLELACFEIFVIRV